MMLNIFCNACSCVQGTVLETADGKKVGHSSVAAREGILMVTLSR